MISDEEVIVVMSALWPDNTGRDVRAPENEDECSD